MRDNVSRSWPILYKTSSKDKELQWEIYVEKADAPKTGYSIITIHGQVGGAQQRSVVSIEQGKNKGRANETTPLMQAISEAGAKWLKQKDKCYSETRGGAAKTYKPMLAHTYEDHKDKVTFPSFIQPKLDGHRCIAIHHGDKVELLSRNGKAYLGLDHIREELKFAMESGDVWDGEIYCHGMTFQRMTSLIKKPQVESTRLSYHIYDAVSEKFFSLRYGQFTHLTSNLYKHLHRVITHHVNSHEEVTEKYKEFVSQEYEGAMLRVGNCEYREGARSNKLLKIKSWMDDEFEVIDVVNGIGKMENQGIFVCKTAEGAPFNVKCKGDDASREEYLANKQDYIGKMLTVKFFEWTTSSPTVPRFPIGIQIREDLECSSKSS